MSFQVLFLFYFEASWMQENLKLETKYVFKKITFLPITYGGTQVWVMYPTKRGYIHP